MFSASTILSRLLFLFLLTLQFYEDGFGQVNAKSNPLHQSASSKLRKPNFVVILIDDLGWADVGFNGSTFYQTPNIDALASKSVQYKNAYAASPVCSPTRAALLTGKHPARLQITDWLPGRADQPSQKLLRAKLKPALPLEERTLPEILKKAGYTSAHIGKWHLGEEGLGPLEQGFDRNIGGDHSGTPASYFYPYANETHNQWRIPGLMGGHEKEYLTDRLTKEAERFMEENRDNPFLLYLPHFAVHIPMRAKEELIEKYKRLASSGSAQDNAIYAAMIQSVDESVGRIVQKLKELEIDDHTVLIFTSDNGGLNVKEGPHTPATSNVPLREGKGFLYEGGIRVPLLIYAPQGNNKGIVRYEPVSSIDLFYTILEMAGVAPGKKTVHDGRSLAPRQKKTFTQRSLYWHYPHYSNQGGKPGWAIRQGDYKLIEFFEDGAVELYDLKTDIGEQHNLAQQLPKKVQELRMALHNWGKEAGAQHMQPNPGYRPALK